MLRRFTQLLARQPRPVILLLSALLLGVVGYVDALTGPELTFAQFYLVPVCLVTWLIGARWGYVMAVASAAVCLWAERMGAAVYTNPLLQEWNFLSRLAFFMAAVWLLAGWKTLEILLAKMVEQRTESLRNEIERREAAQNDLRDLAAQLSAAEDAERRRLAYDIHDSLSQILSLLKINLDAAILEAAPGSDLQNRLKECARTADSLILQTRTMTFDLYPSMLDDLGLVATLQRYAREFKEKTSTEVTVTDDGLAQPIGLPLANYLFRAIKELLSNAVKHGRASELVVGLHWEPTGLRIVVDDDGDGFETPSAPPVDQRRGLGLPGIEQRLKSMGGRLAIESVAGEGSRIILEIPLRPGAQNPKEELDHASVAG